MGGGMEPGRRKRGIGLIATCALARWVYLDLARVARGALGDRSRGEVTPRPDNQVIGAFGYGGPRGCNYARMHVE